MRKENEFVSELAEVIMTLFENKEFVSFADRTINRICDTIQGKTKSWTAANLLFIIFHFLISMSILSLIGFILLKNLLPKEWVYPLFMAVIGSLFIPIKKG